MVTDGIISSFYYVQPNGSFLHKDFVPLDFEQMDTLVKHIVGLGQKNFNSENLAYDFANNENSPSRNLAKALYQTLVTNCTEKSKMLLTEWKHLFKLSHDDVSQQQAIIERKEALSEYFQVQLTSASDEYNALFAMHTSYSILIKLIAFKLFLRLNMIIL